MRAIENVFFEIPTYYKKVCIFLKSKHICFGFLAGEYYFNIDFCTLNTNSTLIFFQLVRIFRNSDLKGIPVRSERQDTNVSIGNICCERALIFLFVCYDICEKYLVYIKPLPTKNDQF